MLDAMRNIEDVQVDLLAFLPIHCLTELERILKDSNADIGSEIECIREAL